TYFTGLGYLLLYNAILIVPLVATLWIAADPALIGKVKEWKMTNIKDVHLWAGMAMIVIGIAVLFI
ncbi:MAG: hypothetical protein KGI59_03575, partial [Patescibacteria group bacterium]|nr:hypothetical protein [Patescibacteria group bacterium]